MTTAETLKFVLLAFGAGIVVPLAIQLFLTLRSLHRTVEATSRRLVQAGIAFDPEQVARQMSELAWAGLRGVRRV